MTTPSAAAGRPTLGHYVLVREIARSNDIVWEGFDPRMNRMVAVKELALTANLTGQARRDRIERFYREARAAGAMNHPNIVTIHDFGEENGRYFIAMEFLEGQTLRDRLSVGGAMGLSEAVAIATALCDALDYAHTRGVVHRDIKPDNVHLLPRGGVKLTDFGIARIQHENQLTVAGQVFGTPSYMSPEQVLGKPIDARTDVFSLGVMLYEMITGRKPFTGDSVPTIINRILNEPTPPLTAGAGALDAVIQRATAKDPAARFASASEMREAILAAEAAHRTGGFHAASVLPSVPPAYPQGPAAATAQYGPQTQLGVAPGVSGGYAPPATESYPPPPVVRDGRAGRVATIVGICAVVLLCFGVLAMGISKAMQAAGIKQRLAAEQRSLAHAQGHYSAGRYEQAAQQALQIRSASKNERVQADATKIEAYSYLALGNAARARDEFPNAEKWYNLARQTLPDDPSVADHLAKFEQAKRYRTGQATSAIPSNPATLPSPGLPSSGIPTPGSTPAVPAPVQPTGPALSANDFSQNNAANGQNAQQLYNEGLRLQSQGDLPGAREKWQSAVAAGPGSPGAQAANEMLTRTAPQF
jgi:serine/threonine-protein kinase